VVPNLAGVVEQTLLFGAGSRGCNNYLFEGLVFQFRAGNLPFAIIHVGFVVFAVVVVDSLFRDDRGKGILRPGEFR